ncbi:fimbrial assembly protein [Pleurocapsa sp. CCALA 161]|uniref:PilN domain-containing protein n=1 Tax=Pleurocapsa sp. CCALA 161 TaxID=2107688 RepID=UPI000D05FDA8|nr:PilN domain-containing protein [Pleurocapsa sp. CCALA 161]PSB09452.1 fimbrial assembly protein [Pleurocapsa sp. CCALA 161]
MYNLDINFLRDRQPNQSIDLNRDFVPKKEPSLADKIPLALGTFVFILAPAITFMYLKNVQASTAEVKTEIQQIESEIADLGNQNKKIDAVNAELDTVQKETTALVGVFEKIKPWAAIMQEVSDRTPPGVLVESIQQTGGVVAPASDSNAAKDAKDKDAEDAEDAEAAEATPPPATDTTGINLAGVARSYEDVNDFVLFLQRSPFFNRQQVHLNEASLTSFPVEIENQDQLPKNATLEIPEGIKFTISAQLNNAPASQLQEEIEKKGSIGLATRLNTLERKGATLK